MNVKMVLAYDGSRYDGWQKQGNTQKTIQGKLEQLLTRLEGEAVEVHGAGRTDKGVHAKGQVMNCHLKQSWDEQELLKQMNHYLPEDIAVLSVEEVEPRFHARLWATGKEYHYSINMSEIPVVFGRQYIYQYGKGLDLEAMRACVPYLVGTHDFRSFCSNPRMKKSTVRQIYDIQLAVEGEQLTIKVRGEGFLYNMVRILVGTLVEVGEGKRSPGDIPGILEAKNRQAAGFTAPPEGLVLHHVEYMR